MQLYLLGLFATDIFNCSWSSSLHSEILSRYNAENVHSSNILCYDLYLGRQFILSRQSVKVPKLSYSIANNSAGT